MTTRRQRQESYWRSGGDARNGRSSESTAEKCRSGRVGALAGRRTGAFKGGNDQRSARRCATLLGAFRRL